MEIGNKSWGGGRGQGTKCLQTPCGHKFIMCQQGILQEGPHFTYSLFLSLCMNLLNTLLIPSLALFWIIYPDLQDLLISLGPRPRHKKKYLVWNRELDKLLSKQGTVQVPLQRTSLPGAHPQSHSASTTEGSLCRGDMVQMNSALCNNEVHKFISMSLRVKCFS